MAKLIAHVFDEPGASLRNQIMPNNAYFAPSFCSSTLLWRFAFAPFILRGILRPGVGGNSTFAFDDLVSMVSRDGDRQLLAAIASHGADMEKAAHTIHYLYFKSLSTANSAAKELRGRGYQNLRVHRAPISSFWKRLFGPKEYSCIAEIHAVLSESAVFATTDRMNALAAKYGGDYDGWEASIEK